MSKTKVLYIIIIIGLVIFITTNIPSSFVPNKHFRFMSSIHLLGKQKNENVLFDEADLDKLLLEASSVEKKEDYSNNDKDSFRKHTDTGVIKHIHEDKNSGHITGGQVVDKSGNVIVKTNSEGNMEKSPIRTAEETKKINANSEHSSVDKKDKASRKDMSVDAPLKLCPVKGSKLVGPLFIDQEIPKPNDEKALSIEYGGTVEKGGWWAPSTCTPRMKVAIIIPYRNREQQLQIFLHHLHPILQRQKLFYRIIVVEQLSDDPFNRAGLFNIGFVESLKISPFDCFVFSDVDLLPEDDRNYYGCPTSPRHMSVAVDKFNYKLPYATIFGGVGAFTKEHFEAINGMSNLFWGWGGEDDDLYQRITNRDFPLTRPSIQLGRYTMIRIHHFQSSQADPNRMNLLRNSKERMVVDGLNTLKYHLREVVEAPLVTFVKIEMKKRDYFQ